MQDKDIIELFWQRDEAAITETDAKYGKYCRKIALNVLGSQEDAEECVSDTWFRTWNAIPQARPNHFQGFLAKITRNIAIDRWKRQSAAKRGKGGVPLALEELGECVSGRSDVAAEYEAKELYQAIDAFVGGLPEREQFLFVQRYFYLEAVREIAETLRIRPNHATVTLARIRKRLKAYLQQEEIGRYEITEQEDLRQIYEILQGMTCYGNNHWELIDYGASDEGMVEGVRLGRYLTIELHNGAAMDALKYTAVSGMFYEFYGVAYNRLNDVDRECVDRILRIEKRYDAGMSATQVSGEELSVEEERDAGTNMTQVSQEAPVDEENYHEAHRYSDEIEAAQYAISQAMARGELPFVTSSAIHEDPGNPESPVRIVVTVNTTDETFLRKLKEYDTENGILEIKYSAESARLE